MYIDLASDLLINYYLLLVFLAVSSSLTIGIFIFLSFLGWFDALITSDDNCSATIDELEARVPGLREETTSPTVV